MIENIRMIRFWWKERLKIISDSIRNKLNFTIIFPERDSSGFVEKEERFIYKKRKNGNKLWRNGKEYGFIEL